MSHDFITTSAAAKRLVLAGGFAVAALSAPVLFALGAPIGGQPLAACPEGQEVDIASGACRPATTVVAPTFNPINPENAPLQPGSLTGTEPGNVGRLPEVNGIPCTGDNTGLCIGLTENNDQFGGNHQPQAPGQP